MNIQIPEEALEAAAMAAYKARCEKKATWEDIARAAFEAMVKAWPGAGIRHTRGPAYWGLPLTEKQDDKA